MTQFHSSRQHSVATIILHDTTIEASCKRAQTGLTRLPLLAHRIFKIIRMLSALILSLVVVPLLAPALLAYLPNNRTVQLLERFAVSICNHLATVAGVHVSLGAKCDVHKDTVGKYDWLHPPTCSWESPISRDRTVKAFDQAGRWMTDDELNALRTTLVEIGQAPWILFRCTASSTVCTFEKSFRIGLSVWRLTRRAAQSASLQCVLAIPREYACPCRTNYDQA